MRNITKKIQKAAKEHKKNISNENKLVYFPLQVIYSLPDNKMLGEEINFISAICLSATAYHHDVSIKVCELTYHADDRILELDIAFAAPSLDSCIKACTDLLNCPTFPSAAECFFQPNKRSQNLIIHIWRDEHANINA